MRSNNRFLDIYNDLQRFKVNQKGDFEDNGYEKDTYLEKGMSFGHNDLSELYEAQSVHHLDGQLIDEEPSAENFALYSAGQALKKQKITHAGSYRIAYDRLKKYGRGVIEPEPGRSKRNFEGTAALQAALNTWAPLIQKVETPPKYILTAGLYVDKPGEHGKGNAIDVDGLWWSDTNKFVAWDAPKDWPRYLTIEATLRKAFGTVLNHDYNAAHHDHWHCDLGRSTKWRAVRSQANYAQRALKEIWGATITVDGDWGSKSKKAAADKGYDFAKPEDWDRFLDDIINR